MNNCYYYYEKNQLLVIKFYVQPAAKKTEIVGIYNESIKCKLSAPPVDGKANSELVKFLKKLFGGFYENKHCISFLRRSFRLYWLFHFTNNLSKLFYSPPLFGCYCN